MRPRGPENNADHEGSYKVVPGVWAFRAGGSKLPRVKAQASLRAPKGEACFASIDVVNGGRFSRVLYRRKVLMWGYLSVKDSWWNQVMTFSA
jgi:hypothetical protein